MNYKDKLRSKPKRGCRAKKKNILKTHSLEIVKNSLPMNVEILIITWALRTGAGAK